MTDIEQLTTLSELGGALATGATYWGTLGTDNVDSAFGTVGITYKVGLRLRWSATPTDEELRELAPRLRIPSMRARGVRMVLALPEALVPVVVPELQSIIDYESRMLARKDARKLLPRVADSNVSIPVRR